MPEVQEVFRMATQKVRPDPGFVDRQQDRRRKQQRNRKVGAFAVVAAIALAVVSLILTRPGGEATIPASESPTRAPLTPTGPYFLNLQTGEMTPLASSLAGGYSYVASPDGTRVAYGSSRGGGCAESSVTTVADIHGTNARTLETPEGLIACGARWSPDGTKLVYQLRKGASSDDVGNLFIQDLASGQTTQLTDLKLAKAWWWYLAPSFSPDGLTVFFQLPRSSSESTKWDAWSVPVAGGEPTLVIRNASFPMRNPEGPEGSEIAWVSPEASDFAGHSILIGAVDGHIVTKLVEANSSIWWPTMSPDGTRIAYQDGGSIYVVHTGPGEPSKVADGDTAEWLDNHTLIVTH